MKTVTAAIITRGNEVLLTRRGPTEKLAGYWEFPGGKLEDGESLADCLRRELNEELGVDANVGEVMAESEYHYEHGSFLLVGMYANLLSDQFKLTVHDLAEWVPIVDITNYQLAPADIPIANEVIKNVRSTTFSSCRESI